MLLSLRAILNEVNESTRMRESQEFFHAFSQHVLWESTVCPPLLSLSLAADTGVHALCPLPRQPIDLVASKCFVLHSGRVDWTYRRVARTGQPDDADKASTVCLDTYTHARTCTHDAFFAQQQGNFALLLNSLVVLADFNPVTGMYHEKKALPVGGMRLPCVPCERSADALDITIELFSTKKLFVSDSPGSPAPPGAAAAAHSESALPPPVSALANPSAAAAAPGTPSLSSPSRSDTEADLPGVQPRGHSFRTKYLLVLRCADFLDMQSWRSHLKTAMDASTATVPTLAKARARRDTDTPPPPVCPPPPPPLSCPHLAPLARTLLTCLCVCRCKASADAGTPSVPRSRTFLLFPTMGAAGAPRASSSPARHQRTATAGGSCPPETRALSPAHRSRKYRLSVEISRAALQGTSALTTPTTTASPKRHRRLHSASHPDMSLP